jgi:excisionase family DNA binding protein
MRTMEAPKQLPEKLWLTIPEAGALFGMSEPTAYRAAKSGDLPTIRMGGKRIVPTAKLREMLGVEE